MVTVEEGPVTLVGVETISVVAVEEGPVTLVGVVFLQYYAYFHIVSFLESAPWEAVCVLHLY